MQSWCGHTRARPPLLHAQVARTGRVVTLAAPQRMFANERQTVLEGFSGDVIGLTNPGAFGACADVRTCMCFASGRVCACLGMCSCLLQDMINLTNTRGACGAHAGAFVHMQTPLCTCGRLCSTRAGAHAGTHAGALGAHAGAHAGALGAQAGAFAAHTQVHMLASGGACDCLRVWLGYQPRHLGNVYDHSATGALGAQHQQAICLASE
eukprot:scaffold25500_cov22-Tisochrysis_lutea.AAC.1